MKLKSIFFGMLLAFTAMLTSALFTSCGEDDEPLSGDLNTGGGGNSNNDSSSIPPEIAKYVTASASYHDYAWDITLKTNIPLYTPHMNVKYGLECGYNNQPNIFYSKDFNVSGTSFSTLESIFVDNSLSPYDDEPLYWNSYMALKKKKEEGETLSSDEKDLYRFCVSFLNKSTAKSEYWGHIIAKTGGKKYIIMEFGNKRLAGNNPSTGGNSGGSSGGSTSYEKPDVTFDDYFPNYTSMKVSYKVWNGSKAKLQSAKVYYGTSSNPTMPANTTFTNSVIYGNLSGLKAGTTYYVKCVATGPGGTTTTSVTKCRTNSY